MFIAESAVAARDVVVDATLDSTPKSYSTITTVVLLQLSLALFLWALFRDAEPKSDGPAEQKKRRHDPSVFYGLCVEYAATGLKHQDRAPCRVTLVDFCGKLLIDAPIWVPSLQSPLTPVTGLTRKQI